MSMREACSGCRGNAACPHGTSPGRSCCALRHVAYQEATISELQLLIRTYLRQHKDPTTRAAAENRTLVNLKVLATHRFMRDLIRQGLDPVDAETRAIKQVALVD